MTPKLGAGASMVYSFYNLYIPNNVKGKFSKNNIDIYVSSDKIYFYPLPDTGGIWIKALHNCVALIGVFLDATGDRFVYLSI